MEGVSRRWYPAVAVAVALFVASVVPVDAGGGSGPVGADKIAHVVGYAVLTGALVVAFQVRHRTEESAAASAAVGAVAYGIGIELVQAGITYRAFSVADIAANGAGAIAAGIAWVAARRFG